MIKVTNYVEVGQIIAEIIITTLKMLHIFYLYFVLVLLS